MNRKPEASTWRKENPNDEHVDIYLLDKGELIKNTLPNEGDAIRAWLQRYEDHVVSRGEDGKSASEIVLVVTAFAVHRTPETIDNYFEAYEEARL